MGRRNGRPTVIELVELRMLGLVKNCVWCKASGNLGRSECFKCHGEGYYFLHRSISRGTCTVFDAMEYRATFGHWPGEE